MLPSSSAFPQAPRSQTHSRRTSNAAPQQSQTAASTSLGPPQDAKPRKSNLHYTVFIRLPFPRAGFEDPPPVDWTSIKDKQLWKLISSASNSTDLDWEAMSERFEVPLAFLLQQAAWLYQRHFEGMRAQMKRLGAGAGVAAKEGEGSAVGEVAMGRKGSNEPKLPLSLNTQRGLQSGGDSHSSPATPRTTKPLLSRNPSTSTVTQSRVHNSSPRQGSLRAFRGSSGSQRRPPPPVQNVESSQDAEDDDDESALGHDGASETDSEQEERSTFGRGSNVTRRPPLGKKSTLSGIAAESDDGDAEDDEEESSGEGYLPFAAAASTKAPGRDDPSATLRGSPKKTAIAHTSASNKGKAVKAPPPESSESSASSAPPSQQPSDPLKRGQHRGPLSPKQRAQLAQLSPRYKSGSEGSPSMGSSFSDLDELSVTQSALEEALMSNMQHGSIGVGSRMSGLRDALGRK